LGGVLPSGGDTVAFRGHGHAGVRAPAGNGRRQASGLHQSVEEDLS
jgi:hypothetical protein